MSQASQALWFNAVPLLVVAAAHAGAATVLLPSLWAERRRATLADAAVSSIFPCVAAIAAVYATTLLVERKPPGGGVWLTFGAAIVAALPAFLVLVGWSGRAGMVLRGSRVRDAKVVESLDDRERESLARILGEVGRSHDAEAVGRLLLVEAQQLVAAEVACLAVVSEDGRTARGLVGRSHGTELDWFPEVTLDLENEPSGIATAVFDATPFAIYDAVGSSRVSSRLVAAVGAKSVAYLPLIAEERVIAVLVVCSTSELRSFTAEELSALTAISAEAGVALFRTRSTIALADAQQRERRRMDQQGALLRAAKALTSELQLEVVLQRLVEQVATLLGGDAADCYLYDPERNSLRCEAVHALPADLVGFEFPADRGAAGEAIRRGGPVIATDYAELDEPVPNPAYEDFRSAIVAPMRLSGAVQGVLGVGIRGERSFTEEDADLLEAFAGLASLALANAQAYEARTRQANVQRGFFRIASVLGRPLSLPETLEAVAQAATEAVGGSFAAVLTPRGEDLVLAGSSDLPAPLAEVLETGLPDTASCLQRAAADARVVASTDVRLDDRFESEWAELAERGGYRGLLAVPVPSPREDGNSLVIVFFAGERSFTDEDLELARHLGDAARGALERSDLFEAERTARTLSQQLARTGGVLATELDPAAVLEEVAQQAPSLLEAGAGAIRSLEDDLLVVSAATGEGAEEAIGTRSASTAWLSGDVFQSRAPVAIEDASADDRLLEADPILAAGYCAYLGVPLMSPDGAVHGVLAVYDRRPRRWRPEEIDALTALAANTSTALSNAELYSRVAIEKERSVAILANIADGIVAVDREGNVVLWNAAAEEITGVPASEALGRTPAQVLQRSLESEDDVPPQTRLVSIQKSGDEVWLSLSEAVMRDPGGVVAGRIFAFRDISADLMVEEVKSNFVARVSHELRTPLTSIYGFAETLMRRDVLFGEDERRTFLSYIASESERLTNIVDQLLIAARLDAGDLQVEIGSIDVRSVVSEVVQTAEETGTVNGHSFEVDLPDEPLAAEGDRDKVRQVFNILVENAIKYSPDGGRVMVGARRRDDVVEVRVADEGIGIAPAQRDRIFRKFYSASEGSGGTGIGLFIARELVAAMGGQIRVDSTEGQGSSFQVELPASKD